MLNINWKNNIVYYILETTKLKSRYMLYLKIIGK